MREKLTKMLAAKNEQRDTLNNSIIEAETKEERAAIGETLSALAAEIKEIETMLAELDQPAEEVSADPDENIERGMNIMATMDMRHDNTAAETRAKALHDNGSMTIDNAEARAILVSSGNLATPTEVAGINDVVGARVSSIVDMVKVVDASGMGAYKVAYQITDAAAAATAEGADYNESEPTFGFVEITPETATCISYISKQARKQTPLAYAAKVNDSARIALRKFAATKITNAILGSALVTKKTAALDEKFLRTVALSYGNDDSVVGAAVLQISKADLITLGDVRGSDKKPVYEITPDSANPNTGIIKDGGLAVPYVLNSNLAGKGQIYGQMHNFELALFSNYEISASEDFKFNKGLLAIAGDVQLGGDVVAQGGFVVAAQA